MTEDELSRAGQEAGHPLAERGFYVFEILAAESAFTRRPAALRPTCAAHPAATSGRMTRSGLARAFELLLAMPDIVQHPGNVPFDQELH